MTDDTWQHRLRKRLFFKQMDFEDWLLKQKIMDDDRYVRGSWQWRLQNNGVWTVLEGIARLQCVLLTHYPIPSDRRPSDGLLDHCAWCPTYLPWSVPR